MILVAGGTGRLGSLVVEDLARRGHRVRVLARDPSRATGHAETVRGDVRDRAAVADAVRGATAIVSCVQGFAGRGGVSPASVDRDGNINLIDAARADGAGFVLVSVLGAAPDSPMELMRMKHAAERHLEESGVPATVVQPAAFLELWIEVLRQTARRGGRPVVFGRGQNPIDFVSVADVAAVVTHAVLEDSLRGRTLQITGPRRLTFDELAAAVQQADGRSAPPRHVPRAGLRVAAETAGRAVPSLRRPLIAALAMDTAPPETVMDDARTAIPGLPCTDAAAVCRPAPAL